jgi:hypothetical protein
VGGKLLMPAELHQIVLGGGAVESSRLRRAVVEILWPELAHKFNRKHDRGIQSHAFCVGQRIDCRESCSSVLPLAKICYKISYKTPEVEESGRAAFGARNNRSASVVNRAHNLCNLSQGNERPRSMRDQGALQ